MSSGNDSPESKIITIPSPTAALMANLLARVFHIQLPFLTDNGLYDLAAKLEKWALTGTKEAATLTLVVSDRWDLSILVDGAPVGRVQDFQFHAGVDSEGNPGVAAVCEVVVTPTSGEQHVELLRRIPWIKVTEERHGFPVEAPSPVGYFPHAAQVDASGAATVVPMDPVARQGDLLTMPSTTPEMLASDPLFNAIYEAIRSWDVNVPACYVGYCGANGSHAAMIYASVKRSMGELVNFQAETPEATRESLNNFVAAYHRQQEKLDTETNQMATEIVEAQAKSCGWPVDIPAMDEAIQFCANWVGAAAQCARNETYWRERAKKAEASAAYVRATQSLTQARETLGPDATEEALEDEAVRIMLKDDT